MVKPVAATATSMHTCAAIATMRSSYQESYEHEDVTNHKRKVTNNNVKL